MGAVDAAEQLLPGRLHGRGQVQEGIQIGLVREVTFGAIAHPRLVRGEAGAEHLEEIAAPGGVEPFAALNDLPRERGAHGFAGVMHQLLATDAELVQGVTFVVEIEKLAPAVSHTVPETLPPDRPHRAGPINAVGSQVAISGKMQSSMMPTTMQSMKGRAPRRMVGSLISGAMPLIT